MTYFGVISLGEHLDSASLKVYDWRMINPDFFWKKVRICLMSYISVTTRWILDLSSKKWSAWRDLFISGEIFEIGREFTELGSF